MNSGSDEEANWQRASELVRDAAAKGARWVGTPENTNYLGPHAEKVKRAEILGGPTCKRFAELAADLEIYLLLGSFNELSKDPERCFNTSVLFGPTGERIGVYRKIHLFDIDVSEAVRFKESDTVVPGDELVVIDGGVGRLGLSICYDLRFPELYRELASRGARAIAVPSAFTKTTGTDHWHVLLRARAIENQCYILAPAQCGHHDDQGLRESYGHAMIVDPWGEILAVADSGPGIALAEVDHERVSSVREGMPVHEHRRL